MPQRSFWRKLGMAYCEPITRGGWLRAYAPPVPFAATTFARINWYPGDSDAGEGLCSPESCWEHRVGYWGGRCWRGSSCYARECSKVTGTKLTPSSDWSPWWEPHKSCHSAMPQELRSSNAVSTYSEKGRRGKVTPSLDIQQDLHPKHWIHRVASRWAQSPPETFSSLCHVWRGAR